MPHLQKTLYELGYMRIYFETPYEEIRYLKEIVEIDDQLPNPFYYILGDSYVTI